jgi:ribulose-5-phosphate 4-epimerase/fuculose-1-phosphate aldolase
MTEAEWKTRCDLAALYRIAELLNWSDSIFTHITARVPDEENSYLINSYGLLFDEVTASNLVKVTTDGEKLSPGRINGVALTLHNILHSKRKNINFIIHTHTPTGVAVSADKRGLLPLSQQSLTIINSVAYHDYEGVFFWEDEQERIISDLGDKDILILKNHGLVATASNIASCFSRMYMLESACSIQCNSYKESTLIGIDTINKSVNKSFDGSNSKSTVLMWQSMLRKLDRLKINYKE